MAVGGFASAATITVTPGQTIQAGINSAKTGDTVVVQASTRTESITLSKSITVRAETAGAVTLHPGGYTAISIQCSNCAVIGFTAQDFEQAVSGTGRSNVTLQDLKFTNAGAGIMIDGGSGWLVERIDLEFHCRDGEDYMDALSGSGHTFRRLYFHGLRIPGDLGPGPNYKHSDVLQTWVVGGATGLKNTVVEECIFTDFMEGVYLNNEAFTTDAVNNITVRNNVFWGTSSQASGNWLGSPSVSTQFTGPATGSMNIKNNIFRTYSNGIRLYNQSNVGVEGNIFDGGGTVYSMGGSTTASSVKRGTLGNLLWGGGWNGGVSGAPDKTNVNPQYRNAAAVGAAVVGPDGIPWTSDDAWIPTNSAAAAYGPQLDSTLLADLRDLLPALDLNQDGALTLLESGLAVLTFAKADLNADGRVTIIELLQLTVGPVGVATTVYVDSNYTGSEDGSASRPFNTLYEAANFVAPGGDVITVQTKVVEPIKISGPMTLDH